MVLRMIHPPQVEMIVPGDDSKVGVQEVIALVDENGIDGGEDLGELGDGVIDAGQVTVIENDRQGELPEGVPVDHDLLVCFSKLLNERFLAVVHEKVVSLRESSDWLPEVAEDRHLGVMVVPPPALNALLDLAAVNRMPLRANDEAGFDFQELLEDQWKALAGGLFQGENLDEIVVQQQVTTVAFQGAVGKIIVEESVMLAPGKVHLVRSKVQEPFQNAEGLVLVKKSEPAEIAELSDEAVDLVKQRADGCCPFRIQSAHLDSSRETANDFLQATARLSEQFGEAPDKRRLMPESLIEDDVVDLDGIELFGPGGK